MSQATSALDAESEAAVQSALDRAMQSSGRAIIVIAHRCAYMKPHCWMLVCLQIYRSYGQHISAHKVLGVALMRRLKVSWVIVY